MKRFGLPLTMVILSILLALLIIAQKPGGSQRASASPALTVAPVTTQNLELCAAGAKKTCPKGQERCGSKCYDPKASCCCNAGQHGFKIIPKRRAPNCEDSCRAAAKAHRL
jgi:hypothetical protein